MSPAPATSGPAALREFSYWLHRYRRTWRGTVVISIVNPLLFLVAVGVGLGRLVDENSSGYLDGHSYLGFFAPGLLAAAVMQSAFVDSAGPVFQSSRVGGNYRAAAATPMRPADIFIGHLLFMTFRITTGALAFITVSVAMGAVGGRSALLLLPAAILTGLAFAAPLAAWAVTVTRADRVNVVFRFVLLPLYMFSGTFYSPSQLPDRLHTFVALTPLSQGIQLCRELSLSTATTSGTLTHVGYLGAMTAGGVLLGLRTYTRHLHN